MSPNSTFFVALRGANLARIPEFRNSRGQLVHTQPDGSDWTPAQWLQAVIGELGEYAEVRKKFERGDIDADLFQFEAGKELADTLIYLDILAMQFGLSLAHPVVDLASEAAKPRRATPAGWLQGVQAALGTYALLHDEFQDGMLSVHRFESGAGKAVSRVASYLNVLAATLGIDLRQATIQKFNEVGERVGCSARLGDGYWYYAPAVSASAA